MYAFFVLEFSYSTNPLQEKLTIIIVLVPKSQISQIILNNSINIRAKQKKKIILFLMRL